MNLNEELFERGWTLTINADNSDSEKSLYCLIEKLTEDEFSWEHVAHFNISNLSELEEKLKELIK